MENSEEGRDEGKDIPIAPPFADCRRFMANTLKCDEGLRLGYEANVAMLLHDRYGITDYETRNQAARGHPAPHLRGVVMTKGITQEEMDERFRKHLKSITDLFESGVARATGAEWEVDVKTRVNDAGIIEKRPGDSQTWTFKVQVR